MKIIRRMIVTGAILTASAQAQAADWWCVLGAPDAPIAQFVDVDTVVRTGNQVSLQILRFDKAGLSQRSFEHVGCDVAASSSDHRALRDFACGTMDYRMNNGVILGTMTPSQAAHVIFASRPIVETGKGQRPAA